MLSSVRVIGILTCHYHYDRPRVTAWSPPQGFDRTLRQLPWDFWFLHDEVPDNVPDTGAFTLEFLDFTPGGHWTQYLTNAFRVDNTEGYFRVLCIIDQNPRNREQVAHLWIIEERFTMVADTERVPGINSYERYLGSFSRSEPGHPQPTRNPNELQLVNRGYVQNENIPNNDLVNPMDPNNIGVGYETFRSFYRLERTLHLPHRGRSFR